MTALKATAARRAGAAEHARVAASNDNYSESTVEAYRGVSQLILRGLPSFSVVGTHCSHCITAVPRNNAVSSHVP